MSIFIDQADKTAHSHARGTFGLCDDDRITETPTRYDGTTFEVRLPFQAGYGQGVVLARWSGKAQGFELPPAIGTELYLSINNIGLGQVTGYFVESGFLGLTVTPHNPPEWWTKQNPTRKPCTVFGTEIKPLTPALP